MVEASLQRGKIVLTPKMVIDRSKFSTADNDYTPLPSAWSLMPA